MMKRSGSCKLSTSNPGDPAPNPFVRDDGGLAVRKAKLRACFDEWRLQDARDTRGFTRCVIIAGAICFAVWVFLAVSLLRQFSR